MVEQLWPADQVERWPVEKLIPYARNARQHSEAQVAQIAASIKEWGWTVPVLADEEGGLIAGHGRVLAARLLKLPDVPVMVARGWSEAQKRAYVLADNKLAENATWDTELLRVEMRDLQELGFGLELTGFDDIQIGAILADPTDGLTDPDDAPELPEQPVSVPGDLWVLGHHRLLCGDSTVATDVERVLGGVEPHLMVTDPPYGVEYRPGWRNEGGVGSAAHGVARDEKVTNDDCSDWRSAWSLFPGDVAYVWCASLTNDIVISSLEASGLIRRAQIIWAKQQFAIGRGHYHWQHEALWYCVRKGREGHWVGGRKQSTIWNIIAPNGHQKGSIADKAVAHGTQKPVECMKRPIENNSSPGQAIYEPFSGSGTTIISAEITGRACHALELSPQYIDVAVKRWQDFAGKEAVLDGDGRTFAEIAAQRSGSASPEAPSRQPEDKAA